MLSPATVAAQPAVEWITGPNSGSTRISQNHPPVISADGRFVAFEATNPPPGQGGRSAIYVHDRVTHITTIESLAFGGGPANGDCTQPGLSGDGRVLVFQCFATNILPDITSIGHLFARDRHPPAAQSLSTLSSGGSLANSFANLPSVALRTAVTSRSLSGATNLVPGANARPDQSQIYTRDLVAGTTTADSASRRPGWRPTAEAIFRRSARTAVTLRITR